MICRAFESSGRRFMVSRGLVPRNVALDAARKRVAGAGSATRRALHAEKSRDFVLTPPSRFDLARLTKPGRTTGLGRVRWRPAASAPAGFRRSQWVGAARWPATGGRAARRTVTQPQREIPIGRLKAVGDRDGHSGWERAPLMYSLAPGSEIVASQTWIANPNPSQSEAIPELLEVRPVVVEVRPPGVGEDDQAVPSAGRRRMRQRRCGQQCDPGREHDGDKQPGKRGSSPNPTRSTLRPDGPKDNPFHSRSHRRSTRERQLEHPIAPLGSLGGCLARGWVCSGSWLGAGTGYMR